MESLIALLNDKYLDLQVLLTEFDEALANTVEVETFFEDETGRHPYTAYCIDEDGIFELQKIYNRLEKIVGGVYEIQNNN